MIKVNFPSKMEAIALLKQKDDYLNKLNQYNFDLFNIQNKEEYLKRLESCPIEFNKQQVKRIELIFNAFNTAVVDLFPINANKKENLVVNMIKSDGSECGLAYTRLNYIVFTDRMSNFDAYIVHELFHVISRQNPLLTNLLYEELGFKKNEEDLLDLHGIQYILNPDAPVNNYYLSIDRLKIIPYAKNLGLQYKFLILDENNNIADLPRSTRREYKQKFKEAFHPISYLIHPEEIIAELWTSFWIKQLDLKSTVSNHNIGIDHHLVIKMINILKDFEIRA